MAPSPHSQLYNERSARYRIFKEEFYVPSLEDLPGIFDDDDLKEYEEMMHSEHKFYERMLEKAKPFKEHRKRTREVFRGVLGTAYYTEFYWTLNFRALMNFLELRLEDRRAARDPRLRPGHREDCPTRRSPGIRGF